MLGFSVIDLPVVCYTVQKNTSPRLSWPLSCSLPRTTPSTLPNQVDLVHYAVIMTHLPPVTSFLPPFQKSLAPRAFCFTRSTISINDLVRYAVEMTCIAPGCPLPVPIYPTPSFHAFSCCTLRFSVVNLLRYSVQLNFANNYADTNLTAYGGGGPLEVRSCPPHTLGTK
jgi:hypothetical protein